MVDIVSLKPSEIAILDALGTFRFLTAEQMVTAGAGKTKSALYTLLKSLTDGRKAPVAKLDFGSIPGRGRLSQVYYLTARGGELLADAGRDADTIQVPKRVRLFGNDYDHRLGCVDFHVALTQWAKRHEQTIERYVTYYAHGTKSSAGDFSPGTTVSWSTGKLTADAVFQLRDRCGIPRLFCFELHRGTEVRRIVEQFHVYVEAVRREAIESTFDYPHAARILLVFEELQAIATFRKRIAPTLADLEAGVTERFYLHALENVLGAFHTSWCNLRSEAPHGHVTHLC